MSGSPVVSRTLTIVAVAFLSFDGAALTGLGVITGRIVLVPMGLACFIAAGSILLYWRWHRQKLNEIAAARRLLSEEAREIQRLTRKG